MIAHRADGFEIDVDDERLNVDLIHRWLSTDAAWAMGRSRETLERALAGSLNFGVYDQHGGQVAFARAVTGLATFAWLCDVYVDRPHRGVGLGTWLATAIRDHLAPYRLQRVLLSTPDAHAVYARAGFVPFPDPERMMFMSFAG